MARKHSWWNVPQSGPAEAVDLRSGPALTLWAGERGKAQLLADADLLNNGFVTLGVVFLEVVEQATPLADQHEKTAARAVIFLVCFEVLRQMTNALTQKGDLDFRTASVGGMGTVLVNEGLLLLSG